MEPSAIIETTLEALRRSIDSMRDNWKTTESASNTKLLLTEDEQQDLDAWCDEAIRSVKDDFARKLGIFVGTQKGSKEEVEEVWVFPREAYVSISGWFHKLKTTSGPISPVYNKPDKLVR